MYDNDNENMNENINENGQNSQSDYSEINPNPMDEKYSYDSGLNDHGYTGYSNTSNKGYDGYTASDSQENEKYSNYTGYNMNSGEKSGNSYMHNSYNMKLRKEKKKRGSLSKILIVIVAAIVVGALAGASFYGVNYMANNFIEDLSTKSIAEGSDSQKESIFEKNLSGALEQENESGSESEEEESVSLETTSSGNASGGNMTVQEIAAECLPSVVTIAAVSQQELSSIFGGRQTYESVGEGTGVIIGSNETELLIATNRHVISDATSLSVGFIDESTADAQIKGEDSSNDLAVISVNFEDISADTLNQIKTIAIGNSDELELGEQVVAIGNALGYGQSVTSGYISAKGRSLTLSDGTTTFESTDLLQTDAAINAGNSGGPLINMKGELIGINEAKAGSTTSSGASVEGMGYAIPISKAEPILEKLMALETRTKVDESSKGYLGITCANVTSDVSSMYNMPIGVCVTEVIEGSPAQAAGILKGDVVTEIDGRSVETYDDLTKELEYYAAGQTIDFVVMRADNGEYTQRTLSVTLGDSTVLEKYYDSQESSE